MAWETHWTNKSFTVWSGQDLERRWRFVGSWGIRRCLGEWNGREGHSWETPIIGFRTKKLFLFQTFGFPWCRRYRRHEFDPRIRSPGGVSRNPLQSSYLENYTERGAWWAIVHRVSKSQTQLSTHTYMHIWPFQVSRSNVKHWVAALALGLRVTEQLPSEALPVIKEKGNRSWQSHIGPQCLSLEGTNTASG